MRTTSTSSRPAGLLTATAALALALSACSGSDGATTTSSPSGAAGSSAAAPATGAAPSVDPVHGDADVSFVGDMVPHHEGALAMTGLAATRAGSAQVKDLAARISAVQGPQVETMRAMAAAWGAALDPAGHSGGDDVTALTPLMGAEFDREFLVRMTAHHTAALEMARAEVADGRNPQAKALAASVLEAQQAEIAEMRDLLTNV